MYLTPFVVALTITLAIGTDARHADGLWRTGRIVGVGHYCTDQVVMERIAELYRLGDDGAAMALQYTPPCYRVRPILPGSLIEPVGDEITNSGCVGRAWALWIGSGEGRQRVYGMVPDPPERQRAAGLSCAESR